MYYICIDYKLTNFTYGEKYFLQPYDQPFYLGIDDNDAKYYIHYASVDESFISIDKHRKSIIDELL